jgi:hypothetical protein
MVEEAMAAFGSGDSTWLMGAEGLDGPRLEAALRAAESGERPVLLLGTAFAFMHWLETGSAALRFRLPTGSRVMETGGFKGRSRAVPRDELYGTLADRLGIGPEWIVNEYGMTELLSQYYEVGLGEPPSAGTPLAQALEARRLVPPPWLRFRVLDPVTLAPVPEGHPGVIAHFDLANVGSVAAVLTEDLGVADRGGLRLLGRSPAAEPRGCSLAMEEMMIAARGA